MIQTSASARSSDAGFSLVELLIVIFIIGLMSSIAVMTLPEGRTPAVKASDDVAALLNRMSRESILLGEPVRWRHTRQSNAFERFRLGQWNAMYDNGGLYDRFQLDADVQLDIALLDFAGKPEKPGRRKAPEEAAPTIVFLPTGEATAAVIRIRDNERTLTLNLGDDGQLERSDLRP